MKLNPALVAMIFAATGAASCAGVRSGQSDAAGLAAEMGAEDLQGSSVVHRFR